MAVAPRSSVSLVHKLQFPSLYGATSRIIYIHVISYTDSICFEVLQVSTQPGCVGYGGVYVLYGRSHSCLLLLFIVVSTSCCSLWLLRPHSIHGQIDFALRHSDTPSSDTTYDITYKGSKNTSGAVINVNVNFPSSFLSGLLLQSFPLSEYSRILVCTPIWAHTYLYDNDILLLNVVRSVRGTAVLGAHT